MKRALCIFLSILMLLSVLPITAHADDDAVKVSTYQQLWQAVFSKKEYITLASDISYTIPDGGNQPLSAYQFLLNVSSNSIVTVDLNGHTLQVTNHQTSWPRNSALFNVSGYNDGGNTAGSLTVINGTVEVDNYNNTARTDCGVFSATEAGNLTLNDVTVCNNRNGIAVKGTNNSTINLEGGTVMATNGFAVYANGNCNLYLLKNCKLKTHDGSGVVTTFSIAGMGSLHCATPNLVLSSATLTSGVEVAQSNISQFNPASNKYVFVEKKQYNSAFSQSNDGGDYYWVNGTGGYALIATNQQYNFAKNIQVISKSAKQPIKVIGGTASPSSAAYGQTVTITANNMAGKTFSWWVLNNGDCSIADTRSEQTTITMGADAVELKAVYDGGYEVLNTVNINLPMPTYGANPAQATSATQGVTVDDTFWIEVYSDDSFSDALASNYTFKAGTKYKGFVNLVTTDNYLITNSTEVYFVDPATGKKTETEIGANVNIRAGYFTVPELPKVNTLAATVSAVSGQKISAATATAGGSTYTASIYRWYKTDDVFSIGHLEPLSSGTVLQGGETYVVGVKFTAKSGYKLADHPDVTINGMPGWIGDNDSGSRIFYVAITIQGNLNGWVNQDGVERYYKDNVLQKNCLVKDNKGNWYYADANGAMYKGWKQFGSNWRYFSEEDGVMAIGWAPVDGEWYYMDSSGIRQTGLIKLSENWYYFAEDGKMYSSWKAFGSNWRYFDGGIMQTGLTKIGTDWYYFNNSGIRQSGKIAFGSNWRFFKEDGVMATGLTKVEGKWYFLNSSGLKQCNYWQDLGNYKRFFGSDGVMVTGLKKIDGSWYYFNDSGIMQKGWVKFGTDMRYFKPDGTMATGLTKATNGNWYYFNNNGIRQYGWQKFGSNWRYFDKSTGVMYASCTKKIDGKNYTFNSSGICTNK